MKVTAGTTQETPNHFYGLKFKYQNNESLLFMHSGHPTSNAKMRKLKHLHALRTYIEIPEVLWPFCTAAEVSIELPFDFKPINPIIHEE